MSSSSISIFQKLEKFSGQNDDDFLSWLRGFERCCVIAGKSEDPLVKGQLLMLCLTGQALAIGERLEEEKKTPQKFEDIKTKLQGIFHSDADRECKQEEFEKCHLEITESEDEFMLRLIRLHRTANPDSTDAEMTRNVKRKFLNGISSEVKRNIFIFCNNPHSTTVTVDALLVAVRKAKLHMVENHDSKLNVNAVTMETSNDPVTRAIEGLRETLDTHIRSTNEQFEMLNAISNSHGYTNNSNNGFSNYQSNNGYRGRGRGRGRGRERGRGRGPVVCWKCNQPNHVARNCLN